MAFILCNKTIEYYLKIKLTTQSKKTKKCFFSASTGLQSGCHDHWLAAAADQGKSYFTTGSSQHLGTTVRLTQIITQILKYTNTQIHKYINTKIHKYTNTQTQTHKYTNNSEHLGPTHHSLLKFTNTETQNTNYIHTWTNTQIFQNWIKWTPWSKPPAWHKSLLSWSILRLIHKTINFHPSPVSSPLHIKFISYVLGAGLNLLRSFGIYFSILSLLPANLVKEEEKMVLAPLSDLSALWVKGADFYCLYMYIYCIIFNC